MSAVNPRVYKAIFRVKSAYAFDIGGFLMRLYCYMTNIGVVSMLTLAGYSFFEAGLVASAIALSIFLISPRIAKLIDERGQSRIVPKAAALPVVGTLGIIAAVLAHAPLWAMFPCAVLMGGTAGPQALVRARWTYLIRTGRIENPPDLRVAFSYEAILDDLGFMIAPALSIFLASTIVPVAGLAVGIGAYVMGAALLTASRSTEPTPGWSKTHAEAEETAEAEAAENTETPDIAEGETASPDALATNDSAKPKSIFRTSAVVRIIFLMLFFMGAFFGSIDSTSVALAEKLGEPTLASAALMMQAFASILMGFLFGMVRLRMPQHLQLVLTATVFGIAFAFTAFIDSAFLLFALTVPASLTYAPFLITANATCERAVPGAQVTEAIAWINAGVTGGMTVGPTLAGTLIEAFGVQTSFMIGGCLSAAVAVVALVSTRLLKRDVK